MKRNRWLALSAVALAIPALAQQTRPDAGTILETQRQPQPAVPAPSGAPTIVLPPAPAAAAFDRSVRVTPTAFRIQGNTLFPEAVLQEVVQPFVGKPTDMEGLLQAAAAVRRYYRDRGYLLTEAYLPQQQFAAAGGVVTIQVLEARVGRVNVRVEGDGISESLATRIVQTNLHPGDYISEKSLDRPVLLLRDLSGWDATAAVEPGARTGEADITVIVKPFGPRFDGVVGLDNFGVRSAGQYRAYVSANWNNPTGHGDLFSARLQATDRSDTSFYRIGYSIPVGGYATRIGLSATRNEYSLGKQFAALGATGTANVYGISATQPLIRSRANNVLGAITLERKDLTDSTESPPSSVDKRINSVRLSVLGNFVDELWRGSFNSYAVNLTFGNLKLDPLSRAIDQGPQGFDTAGSFQKLNLEFLRTTYLSAANRITATLQAQLASKNLTSAEKLPIGGPFAVRGYPAGEFVGDTGVVINLEYQHQLPTFGLGVPIVGSLFADWGRIKFNQDGAPPPLPGATFREHETLSSVGLGLNVGTYGKYLLMTQLAWRTDNTLPQSDPDKKPRVWLSLQKWF